jgi:hypothetical protein
MRRPRDESRNVVNADLRRTLTMSMKSSLVVSRIGPDVLLEVSKMPQVIPALQAMLHKNLKEDSTSVSIPSVVEISPRQPVRVWNFTGRMCTST